MNSIKSLKILCMHGKRTKNTRVNAPETGLRKGEDKWFLVGA